MRISDWSSDVCSSDLTLGGVLAISGLGVESYPNIAPPQVTVSASYPGASAATTEGAVTQVIKQQLTGIDNLDYFSSSSSSSGRASITLTFKPGTDPDIAQVQVQNKVALATPRLPSEVVQQGVVVAKANPGFLMIAALRSSNPEYDKDALSDLIAAPIRDADGRIAGVLTVAKPNQAIAPFIERSQQAVLRWGLVLLGTALLVGVLAAWWLSRQVGRLQRYAQAVTAGERVEVPDRKRVV